MKEESKTARILRLYDTLRSGEPVDRKAWAALHGICERSVRRDVEAIQQYLAEKNEKSPDKTYIAYNRKHGFHQMIHTDNPLWTDAEFERAAEAFFQSGLFQPEEAAVLAARLAAAVLDRNDQEKARDWTRRKLSTLQESSAGESGRP